MATYAPALARSAENANLWVTERYLRREDVHLALTPCYESCSKALPYWSYYARPDPTRRVGNGLPVEELRVQILLVDDDRAFLETMREALEFEGHEVSTATDGVQALALVQAQPPDLILLDLFMPKMDGVAFTRAYQELPGAHAPIVVLTAASPREIPQDGLGAETLIHKPFDLDALLLVLQQYATSKRAAIA
jgi:CheY-like chemotaxis protein